MNAVVKPYHEMCLNSSELIVPRDTYQRALHPARVARIAREFDERVANEPKISFRDGHYYVMDGQNTIAARKFLNGGEDLQIRCKVYFGMTEREEQKILLMWKASLPIFAQCYVDRLLCAWREQGADCSAPEDFETAGREVLLQQRLHLPAEEQRDNFGMFYNR